MIAWVIVVLTMLNGKGGDMLRSTFARRIESKQIKGVRLMDVKRSIMVGVTVEGIIIK